MKKLLTLVACCLLATCLFGCNKSRQELVESGSKDYNNIYYTLDTLDNLTEEKEAIIKYAKICDEAFLKKTENKYRTDFKTCVVFCSYSLRAFNLNTNYYYFGASYSIYYLNQASNKVYCNKYAVGIDDTLCSKLTSSVYVYPANIDFAEIGSQVNAGSMFDSSWKNKTIKDVLDYFKFSGANPYMETKIEDNGYWSNKNKNIKKGSTVYSYFLDSIVL